MGIRTRLWLGYEISRRTVRGSIATPRDRDGSLTFSRTSIYFERIFKETRKGRRTRRWHDYRLNEHYLPPYFLYIHGIRVSVSSYFLCGFTTAYCLPRYHIYCDLSMALSCLRFHPSFASATAVSEVLRCVFL